MQIIYVAFQKLWNELIRLPWEGQKVLQMDGVWCGVLAILGHGSVSWVPLFLLLQSSLTSRCVKGSFDKESIGEWPFWIGSWSVFRRIKTL